MYLRLGQCVVCRAYIPSLAGTKLIDKAEAALADDPQAACVAYAAAIPFFRAAAERDHLGAQVTLGTMYANGQGAGVDLDKAIHWMSRAADQGDERAAHMTQMYKERQSHRESAPGEPPAVPLHGHGDTEL